MEYAIETKNLVKHYNHGKVHAVNGLNLKIRKGEIYAFIGANGSGKTTTIDMLSGVLMPTAGEMYILGLEQPKNRKKISHYIGIAPQDYSLLQNYSAYKNVKSKKLVKICSKSSIYEKNEMWWLKSYPVG